ncbi:MAG TPA: histidinol-phosphate transaminase [Termitinemataceae bacterium]|nr:histidinol-phosphate transaminase [Termitinemataceae bacterium]HOM24505.1 histidinol-phosphate transaminase [Termitinemataceae bacterium]HPQ01580.1 histidinol-phosphate transaminase [Termitinemataceae bacterium]
MESPYWNVRCRSLAPYVPGEQPRERRYIKLNTNENPYPPSPRVLEAIGKAATETLRLYPDPTCLTLREAIARRYTLPGPEWVFVGNGSDEILAFAFGAFFGDHSLVSEEEGLKIPSGPARAPLLFPDVTYSFYPVYANLWGISYETIPVAEDFSIPHEAFQRPNGGIVLANPNAPTGRALPARDVRALALFQQRQGAVLLVDEAYVDFGAESVVSAVVELDNLLVVHTLSKSRSLAGLRVGYAMGNPGLIEGLRRIRDSFNSYTLDRLALAGAQAAIEDQAYYDDTNKKIIETRRWTVQSLEGLGYRVLPSAANFIFACPPSGKASSGAGAVYAYLRERGILVRYWDAPRIREYLRITIGTDEEMAALVRALKEYTE